MKPSNAFRVVAAALVLSTLSFAAGVAGDLSLATPPNFGERVVLRLPPELPADAVRAGPLPVSLSIGAARPNRVEAALQFEPIDFVPLLKVRNEVAVAALDSKLAFNTWTKPV